MGSDSRSALLKSMQELHLFLEENDSDNNEDEDFSRMPNILKSEANDNLRTSNRKGKLKHVGAQIAFEADGLHYPWLLDTETKLDDFIVKLCNIHNTLHQAQTTLNNKRNNLPSSAASTKRNNYLGIGYRPFHNLYSGYPKLPVERSNTAMDDFPFELVQDIISSTLKSAMELKNKIPKFNSKTHYDTKEDEKEIVKYTTKTKTTNLKIERSKSSLCQTGNLPMQSYKMKRGNTLPTITETKSVNKMLVYKKSEHLNQISCGNGKLNMRSFPKTKNVANVKDTASGNKNQEKFQSEEKSCNLPTKETGAIPKTSDGRKLTSSSTTIRTQKTESTNIKPLWR